MNRWKIKIISCCYFLVLSGCGEEPDTQDERQPPVSITTQEMIIEWNKMVQSATEQFKGKLDEISGQILSEFKTQAEKVLKELKEGEKAQAGQVKKGLTEELNGAIQTITKQFTEKLNEVSGQVLSEFKTQAEGSLKELREGEKAQAGQVKEGLTEELNGAIQTITKQFTEKLNEVSGQVLSEFKTQAEGSLKELREGEKAQAGQVKKGLTEELNGVIQAATKQFTEKLNEVSGQVLSEFKTQAEETLKGMGEKEANQIHLAMENVTKELNGVIQTAATQFQTELSKTLSIEGDNVITEIDKAAQTATADVTASITAAISRFREELTDQFQGTSTTTPKSESLDPVTKIIEEARPVIGDIVRNSELFVDFEVKEIVQQTIEMLNIQWMEITTEEDREELVAQVINTIYSSGKKYTVKNVYNALMDNIRQTVQNITNGIEEMVGLKKTEKTKVTSEIQSETEKAIKGFIDERIRQAVGQAIDVGTAEQAVYILQFDVENTLLHRSLGKPINLFVFLKRFEEPETFSLLNKGDCVKIKKEYLSFVTLVLQYTNPVVGMNFPNSMIGLCNQEEGYQCQAGHYNIQRIGEGQSIDYVLKWRKVRGDQFLSCPEFPEK